MLRVDAEHLARNKRGEYLDLLARVVQPERVRPSLEQRMTAVLHDARLSFRETYMDLDGPVPWADAVMVRVAYRGPRRARLVDLITYLAEHPAWNDLEGELVRAPSQSSGVDKSDILGLSAGLRLLDREIVPIASYPPADTPPELLALLLAWSEVDAADKVYISTWNRDRRVSVVQLRQDLPPALAATSNIGVVTIRGHIRRRLSLNRDSVIATISCHDTTDRRRELDRFADLFWACRAWVTFAGVNRTGMVLLDWDHFLSSGAVEPPYADFWEKVLVTPDSVVPDAYALQLHSPAQPHLQLGGTWDQTTTEDGYRIIRAHDAEPWLANAQPDPQILAAARDEFDTIIARPTNPLGYLGY